MKSVDERCTLGSKVAATLGTLAGALGVGWQVGSQEFSPPTLYCSSPLQLPPPSATGPTPLLHPS